MTLTDRYTNTRSEARLFARVFAEAVAFTYTDLRERLERTRYITLGRAETRDESCQMKGCDDHSVGVFPRRNRWKGDVTVCRVHWLSLHILVRLVLATILTLLVGGPVAMTVMFA